MCCVICVIVWSMCVYVCVISVWEIVCVYVYIYVCIYMCVYVCVCVCDQCVWDIVCVYVYIYICAYVCVVCHIVYEHDNLRSWSRPISPLPPPPPPHTVIVHLWYFNRDHLQAALKSRKFVLYDGMGKKAIVYVLLIVTTVLMLLCLSGIPWLYSFLISRSTSSSCNSYLHHFRRVHFQM